MLQKCPSWKLMSKGEREHIKAYHMSTSKLFQMLVKQRGEKSHVFLREKTCQYLVDLSYCKHSCCFDFLVDCTISCSDFSCSDFLSPYLLPLSNIRCRGRKSPYLGEENLWNSLHIFKIFGDMSVSK